MIERSHCAIDRLRCTSDRSLDSESIGRSYNNRPITYDGRLCCRYVARIWPIYAISWSRSGL